MINDDLTEFHNVLMSTCCSSAYNGILHVSVHYVEKNEASAAGVFKISAGPCSVCSSALNQIVFVIEVTHSMNMKCLTFVNRNSKTCRV